MKTENTGVGKRSSREIQAIRTSESVTGMVDWLKPLSPKEVELTVDHPVFINWYVHGMDLGED